jgi:hypothetical protein
MDEELDHELHTDEGRQDCLPSTPPEPPPAPRWRPAAEPTCCGSGCDDCPF